MSVLPLLIAATPAMPGPGLVPDRVIPLPQVSGRLDHMAFDPVANRLLVAALGQGSLELIDLKRGELVRSIGGLDEPQGIVYVPATREIVVACGGDGTVRRFNADSLESMAIVHLGEDADNVRLLTDGRSVAVGYGSGTVAVLEAATLRTRAAVTLPGHPESFQIEPGEGNDVRRAFINVPDAGSENAGVVVVADLIGSKILATWAIKGAGRNYPMALDAPHGRLFVGCRHPAKLVVLDTADGKAIASLGMVGDSDDIFVTADGRTIYVIGGAGAIDVFSTRDFIYYTRIASVPTSAGCRTGLLVPEHHALYVAVPKGAHQSAGIRQYDVGR